MFVWLRGTLPRLRYDQFMHFGWKVLIPINLVWILAVTAIHVLRDRGWPAWKATGVPLALVLLLVVVPALMMWDGADRAPAAARAAEDEDEAAPTPAFPTPPMDLVVPTPKRLASASVSGPTPAIAEGEDGPMAESPTTEPTGSALGFAKGFGLTFSTMFKKVYTQQYPFDFYPTAPRYHGRHVLNRHPDGLEKCVGCELCAWACPADAIYVEGGDNTEPSATRPVSATARCTRSTTCAASSAACASRPARPGR